MWTGRGNIRDPEKEIEEVQGHPRQTAAVPEFVELRGKFPTRFAIRRKEVAWTPALRYLTEFGNGKPVFQHITASICGGIYSRVYCILYCVCDVVVKKVHVRYLVS